ncbi:hypothetical protein HDV06_001163 [Boothiomyces sp. JEL0866]|nr:hypothetical protein HDV06_001163 [Boothiomyces sp. JEL0866]
MDSEYNPQYLSPTSCSLNAHSIRTRFRVNGKLYSVVASDEEMIDGEDTIILGSPEHLRLVRENYYMITDKVELYESKLNEVKGDPDAELVLKGILKVVYPARDKIKRELDFLTENCKYKKSLARKASVTPDDVSILTDSEHDQIRLSVPLLDSHTSSMTSISEESIQVTPQTFEQMKKIEYIKITKKQGLFVPPQIRQYYIDNLLHREEDHLQVSWIEIFLDLIYVGAISKAGTYTLVANYNWISALKLLLLLNPILSHWRLNTVFYNNVYQEDMTRKLLSFVVCSSIVLMTVSIKNAFDPSPSINTGNWFIGAFVLSSLIKHGYLLVFSFVNLQKFRYDLLGRFIFYFVNFWPYYVLFALPADGTWDRYQTRFFLWSLGLILDTFALSIFVFFRTVLKVLPKISLAVNVEHLTERHGSLIVMVLGEVIVALLKDFSNNYNYKFLWLTIISLLIPLNIFYIYFRSEISDHQLHALRRSRPSTIHILLSLSIVTLAKCIYGLLIETTNELIYPDYPSQGTPVSYYNYEFQSLYIGALSMIYLLVAVLSMTHVDAPQQHTKIKYIRNISKFAMICSRFATAIILLAVGLSLFYPQPEQLLILGGSVTTISVALEEYGRLKKLALNKV